MSYSKSITSSTRQLGKRLLEWYEANGRHDLPWRQSRDPYRVYISEIMLQQTQVERVRSHYYPAFLAKFPTLSALAKAPLDEVLALWSGLGYYQRARNLHKTALLCPDGLPKSLEELKKLPGIGDYTAAAICSFAYDQPVAVVDTNIKRLLSRLFALSSPTPSKLWHVASQLLHPKRPRDHNLALMDLGALVCTAQNPKCEACPLTHLCQAEDPLLFGQNKRQKRKDTTLHFGISIQDGKLAMVRSQKRLYEGMLLFPPVSPTSEPLVTYRHSYTRYNLTIHLHSLPTPPKNAVWIDIQRLQEYPLASLATKGIALLRQKLVL